nr:MAG TPA: hypothetical protein [Caudoviricetes sp.]
MQSSSLNLHNRFKRALSPFKSKTTKDTRKIF